MTDLFAQQGINFQSSSMASTHPTATPAPIETPKVDIANAPANATPATPAGTQQDSGDNPQQAAPQQPSPSLAGSGNEGAVSAGAAPPQPTANSNAVDLFQQQGIKADNIQQLNGDAFNQGVSIPARDPSEGSAPVPEVSSIGKDGKPVINPVAFAQNQQSKDAQLGQQLFTAAELDSFKSNPIDWADVANRSKDYDPAKLDPIKDKVLNNQPLTLAETDELKQWARDTTEVNLRGVSWGGKTAYVGLQVPVWMNQALGNSADEGNAGAPAQGLLLGSTMLPAPYTAQYGEKQLNGVSAITDKGQLILGGSDEAPAKAALASVGHVSPDVLNPTNPFAGETTDDPLTAARLGIPYAPAKSNGLQEADIASYKSAYETLKSLGDKSTWTKSWFNVSDETKQAALKAQQDGKGIRETYEPAMMEAVSNSPIGGAFKLMGGIPVMAELGAFINTVGIPEAQKTLGLRPEESQAILIAMGGAHGISSAADALGKIGSTKYTTHYVPTPETPITVAAKDLSPNVTMPLYNALKAVQPNATVSQLFTSAGWSGMLEKLGPDKIQQILGTAIGDNSGKPQTYADLLGKIVPSKDQTMVEGGLISVASGQHANATIAQNLLQSKGLPESQAQATVASMSSLERDAYVRDNLKLPQSDTPTLANPDVAPGAVKVPEVHADAPQGVDTAKNIVAGGSREANAAAPALINDSNSSFNARFKGAKIYAEMWNDLQPIENLGKQARAAGAPITDSELSPAQLSLAKSTPALIERQWTTGTTTWDAEGNQVETGKGLKQIGDDFDNIAYKTEPNRAARHQDLTDFRKAMTFIEDKTKGYGKVSDKDFNESQATLSRLADKYGDGVKWFENAAKEYRDFDNRILHNLVTSGLKTQAWYDDLVGKREWYASTARVVETEYPEDVAAANARSKGLGADVNPKNIGALKERKGSEREVIDPVQSSMRNSAIIIKRAMLNKVRGDVAKYAEYYPEQVKVKPPAIIREAVQHSYDPKLRTKLEQLVEALGSKIERAAAGEKVGGSKKNLGAYEPATKKTYLGAGTTEGTLTHEVGHMLDHLYGLKDELMKNDKMKLEIEKLAEDRLRSNINLERTPEGKTRFAEAFDRNPQKYIDYVKNSDEVVANFFDSWVNSPEQTERLAPTVKAAFEKFIDKNPDLAALRQIEPSTQRAVETIQKSLLDFKGPKDSVPFYKNGKLMFLHLDPAIAEAFKGLDQVQASMVGNFFQKIGKAQARLLQFGATNNPYFIARHFLRGAQSSYVNTPGGGGVFGFLNHFAVEVPKGIAAVIGKTDAYREWASSSGALRTYMDTSTEGIAKMHERIFDKGDMAEYLNPKNWASLAKDTAVHAWQSAKEVSDYAPRIAAYDRLKAQGYSDLEAGFLSLEATGNYTRHGSVGKQINAYSPFFNDRLQGADRFIRAIARNPGGYATRAIALITLPQVVIAGYYLFAADDETRKEYLNLSDFRRGAAMNVKIDGQWVPIPRAFAPGYVFGALPEQMMIHFSKIAHPELKNFWLHMLGDAVNSLSPSTDWTQTIPPLIKAMIESQTNYSFFRQQPIFHGDTTKTAPENQFNSTTSETAKDVGKVFGISPAKIDNAAYDMAGHIGVYTQQLGDYAINTQRRLMGEQVNEKPTKGSDNPIYGPMMQPKPIGTASESFQEFHEHVVDLEQQHNRDKESVGKDKADFERDNHQDIALYPTVARANTEVMHEEHEIRLITENPHFSGDQKAQQIAQHQQRIEQIVEGANAVFHNVKDKK